MKTKNHDKFTKKYNKTEKKKKRTELEKIWRNTKYENAAIEFDMLKNK